MKITKILVMLLASTVLFAGDGVLLREFAKQGKVVDAPDGRGKVVEIKGATQFQAKVVGEGMPSPFGRLSCVYFLSRQYSKLKDGGIQLLSTKPANKFNGVIVIGDSLVQPTAIDFSKKFKPILTTRGGIYTEEYCLAPGKTYPMVIRVFGSALPPDSKDQVKTEVYYHAEFGPQDW